ncbi:glycoside hydrolase family 15 protein [Lyophyllum atratum]|nr:glycoside hydrolase family 15 protein [Lyophyllum atratum]
MRWSHTLSFVSLPFSLLFLVSHEVRAQSGAVDTYLASEVPIAKTNLLANIGPEGSKAQQASPGIVVASPSSGDNDYLFTWTRDSAIVFQALIDQYVWDGPALRATALITWGNYLISQNNQSYVSDTLWPVIKVDLDYLAGNWNKPGFDIWSDVQSTSFFATAVQHRAFRQGTALATTLGKTDAASSYKKQATDALCSLQVRKAAALGRTASTILGSIHTFDADCGRASDRALANLFTFVNSFRDYAVSAGAKTNDGVAVGRFPEDQYLGGNPWCITTLAVAEQLYDSLIVWKKQGSITVNALSQPFFTNLVPGTPVGTYKSDSATFKTIYTAATNYADSFVAVVAKYTPSGGAMTQQFSKGDGSPTGPADYSWSYAALLTASSARNGTSQVGWGAKDLSAPSTCVGGSGGGSGSTVTMSFNVQANTVFGENIYLAGSTGALGNWSPDNALLLNADSYPTWHVTVKLPASTEVEYKYIRKHDGDIIWEIDPNRHFTTPGSGESSLFDVWRSTQTSGGGGGNGGNVTMSFNVNAITIPGVSVELPAATLIEYKYIRKSDAPVVWEIDPNRHFTTPDSGASTLTDVWQST